MRLFHWLRRCFDKLTGESVPILLGSTQWPREPPQRARHVVEVFECCWCHRRKAHQKTDAPRVPGNPDYSYRTFDPDIALAMIRNSK